MQADKGAAPPGGRAPVAPRAEPRAARRSRLPDPGLRLPRSRETGGCRPPVQRLRKRAGWARAATRGSRPGGWGRGSPRGPAGGGVAGKFSATPRAAGPVPLPPPLPLPFTAPGPSSLGLLAAPGQPAFPLFAFLLVPSLTLTPGSRVLQCPRSRTCNLLGG